MKTTPSHPMALPSRLALWVGVAFFVGAFMVPNIFLAVIGCVFILGGVFLWLRYHPNPLRLPSISFKNKNIFSFFKKILKINKTKDENSLQELQRLKEDAQKALSELQKAKDKIK